MEGFAMNQHNKHGPDDTAEGRSYLEDEGDMTESHLNNANVGDSSSTLRLDEQLDSELDDRGDSNSSKSNGAGMRISFR